MIDFKREFGEEQEILIATYGTIGAGKGNKDKYWNASIGILGYIESGKICKDIKRGEWRLTDAEFESSEYHNRFEDGAIYKIKARKQLMDGAPDYMMPSLLIESVVEQVNESECKDLQELIIDYRKPVFIEDKELGTFELDKELSMFEGKITWLGQDVLAYLNVDIDDNTTWDKALLILKDLYRQQQVKDEEAKTYAAQEMIELANDWREDDDAEITEKDFVDRISLSEISIDSDGCFTLFYDDDDIFAGHSIEVSGSADNDFTDASICG